VREVSHAQPPELRGGAAVSFKGATQDLVVAVHSLGKTHWAMDSHVVRHDVPSHLYGVQSIVLPSGAISV
jgi:hypothetical protein